MPVTIKLPPAAAIKQFFANVPAVQRAYLGDDYHHLRPHKVYELSLAAIAQRKGLAGASLTGWRSLFLEAGVHRAALVSASEDDAHSFLAVEEGPHVESFEAIYQGLDDHQLVAHHDYELCYLCIPSCDVMALWFRGDGHHHELLIPLAPVHPAFASGASYSARVFTDMVESIARERSMEEPVHLADAPADDLTSIEGIGPKAAALLREAGISTLAELAGASPAQLRALLDAGGPRYNLADPASWPEQAALAAAGDWQALEQLQQRLRGGRT